MRSPSYFRSFRDYWQNVLTGKRRARGKGPRRGRRRAPGLEALEDRTLLSTLPPVHVNNQIDVSKNLYASLFGGSNPLAANASSPTLAVDPTDANKMVALWVYDAGITSLDNAAQNDYVLGASSSDGGKTWSGMSGAFFETNTDPVTSNENATPPVLHSFTQATDPSVAFDRHHNFYVAFVEHDAAYNEGAVVVNKFTFAGAAPLATSGGGLVYQWANSDAAFAPQLAVDNNLPTFKDPATQALQSDPASGTVYVAWATRTTAPTATPTPDFNPNSIRIVASADGGNTFTVPVYVNAGGNITRDNPNERNAFPSLVISQGTSDGRVQGGQATVVWDDFGANSLFSNRIQGGGEAFAATGPGGNINSATATTQILTSATNYAVDANPLAVGVGHFFTGDLNADIVSVNGTAQTIDVLRGNGDGTFQTPAVSTPAVDPNGNPITPIAVAVGDFNGDGIDDVAVLAQGKNNVFVFTGKGTGGFNAPTLFTSPQVGGSPTALVVGNFDRDPAGHLDLAVANGADGTVSILLGNGDGSFQGQRVFSVGGSGANPQAIAVADFNNDTIPDLVTANQGAGNVAVLLGNGDGTFQAAKTTVVGGAPSALAVADFNKDNKQDVAVITPAGISVMNGVGDGTFGAPTLAAPGTFSHLVAADFNGDGVQDMAASASGNQVAVLTGKAGGTFSVATTPVGTGPAGLATGFFNADALPDLAVANNGSSNVSVLLGNNGTSVAGLTTLQTTLTVTDPAAFFSHLDVTLELTHPNLSDLLVQLISPVIPGVNGGQPVVLTLFRNAVDSSGKAITPAQGIGGANLGMLNGFALGTDFDQTAARKINDPTSAAPFIGHFRPEVGSLDAPFAGLLADQLNGVWTLKITDLHALTGTNPPPQFVTSWTVRVTTGMKADATDHTVGGEIPGALQGPFPFKPPASPVAGVAPTVALASDNTLGSFSPYQGRIYAAFTANGGDIGLATSDNGGVTWTVRPGKVNDDSLSDNFSGGGRSQFLPAAAVDPVTGTLVLSWYDARNDAANARVATYVASSLDGGATFSPQTYVNASMTATDAITGQSVTLEPIPENQSAGNANADNTFGFGTRQGLAVVNGKVLALWAANENGKLDKFSHVLVSDATIAAGPRIVSGSMGPVDLDPNTFPLTDPVTGQRLADRFVVTFDRPIDPDSFDPADVTVIFRSPTMAGSQPGIPLTATGVTALDRGTFGPAQASGATRFLVTFNPTLAKTLTGSYTGTYSYSVNPYNNVPGKPVIQDRIRTGGVAVTPTGSATYAPDSSQLNLTIPPVGTGGSGDPAQDDTLSNLVITSAAADEVVQSLTVNLTLTHTFDGDLRISLIGPAGNTVLLSNRNGGGGDNYTGTTFSDAATTSITATGAPFSGTFKPEGSLSDFALKSVNGTWTLKIEDLAAEDTGTLISWSLNINRGRVTTGATTSLGNRMDQNSDGVTAEVSSLHHTGDEFTVPQVLNGTLFLLPYSQDTLPLIVAGPHVVSTSVPGQPVTSDNLVLNTTASFIDVKFDRDMLVSSFTPPQVVSFMGPTGAIAGPFTVSPLFSGAPGLVARSFRVGFPIQRLSGTYTLVLGSGILSSIGERLDTNLNAGLDVLRGTSQTGGTNVPVSFSGGTNLNLNVAPGKTVTANLLVTDPFVIQHVRAALTVNTPNAADLEAQLIGPDGTVVQLFTNVGANAQPPRNDFSNTIFDDSASTPIQLGAPPFNNGPYNPQTPLSVLNGRSSLGVWKLVIKNDSTKSTNTATLQSWALTLTKNVPGTGLGEPVADQATVTFRIFTENPTDPLTRSAWTAVGPASINSGARSGRIGGIAVDPSDPSGNTVFIGGASGGVWKTTNFLTTDPNGPTYIPLTDFGPTFGINIGSIAVFAHNNDPRQSIVIAATGEGDTASQGVGFLLSKDGGATWTLQDSLTNVDSTGKELPEGSRDHTFVGTTAFKVIADPTPEPNGEVIFYAALSDATSSGKGGIYASFDTGKHWELLRSGQATDVAFPTAASDTLNNAGNFQTLYGAFRGDGVYLSPNQGGRWNLMDGQVGDPQIRQGDVFNQPAVGVSSLPQPNGAFGRIDLVTPFATGSPVQDAIYAGWLYAVVVNTNNSLNGLYLTKDFGQTWTKVKIPVQTGGTAPNLTAFPVNDDLLPSYDPMSHGQFAQGNYDVSLAIDPSNPNVVYIGGTNDGAPTPAGGLIRVDTTTIEDPHDFTAYNNHKNDGGKTIFTTAGGLQVKSPGTGYGLTSVGGTTPYLNLIRDPGGPFFNSTILVNNASSFANTGGDVRWMPFNDVLGGSTDQHRVVSFRDPLTGHARLIFGDDQGVFTGVDMGDGTLSTGIGTASSVTGSRNGNLQITQFYYGAAQPSVLASEIGGALFYAMAQDDGFPASDPRVMINGNLNWTGPGGDGTGVATDQTGSGTVYQYKWPCCGGGNTSFFQVTFPGGTTVGSTRGLLQAGDNPATGQGEWPFTGGSNFAVNPIDPKGVVISSQVGRIFRTTDQAGTWDIIGQPTDLDSSYAPAVVFGAPAPNDQGALDNFIYAGTLAGHIFVTFTGGNNGTSSNWLNLSAGLDGSSVQQIVTNPHRGSHEAYAVTLKGVYHMADSSAPNASWVNVTGNLFSITHNSFGDPNLKESLLKYLTSIQADWRFVIPDDPKNPTGPAHPALYVGGEGGVFRSVDGGKTWSLFPSVAADGAVADGGLLPDAHITSLNLSVGNLNNLNGVPNQATGLNVLYATTYGRGTFAIRLPLNSPFNPVSGPKVTAFTPSAPLTSPFSSVTVTFSGPVDPNTLTAAQVKMVGPAGVIVPTQIRDIITNVNNPLIHSQYEIDFATQSLDGFYTIIIGPNVSDFAGNLMDQDGNHINGEPTDAFTTTFSLTSTDDGRFMFHLFNDLLGRNPNNAEFAALEPGIETGRFTQLYLQAYALVTNQATRQQLVSDLFQSASAVPDTGLTGVGIRGGSEVSLGNLIGHAPSQTDLNTFVGLLNQGFDPMTVVNFLVGRDDYLTRAGGTEAGFLTQLTTDLLGRLPTSAESTADLAKMAQDEAVARFGALATLFYNTSGATPANTAYAQAVSNDTFQWLLGRGFDATKDPTDFTAYLAAGGSREAVAAFLLANEFNTGQPNDQYLQQVYAKLLPGLVVTPGGAGNAEFNAFLGALNNGLSRGQAVSILLTNPSIQHSYLFDPQFGYVAQVTHDLLGSGATPDLATAKSHYGAGLGDQFLFLRLMISPQYVSTHSGGATSLPQVDQNWLNSAFTDAFGFDLGDPALSHSAAPAPDPKLLAQIDTAEVISRMQVAQAFIATPEFRIKQVDRVFLDLVGHAPSAQQLTQWTGALAGPSSPGLLPSELLAFTELSSSDFFFLQSDAPSGGLHTNTSWAQGVYNELHLPQAGNAALGLPSVAAEVKTVNDGYAAQRINAVALVVTNPAYTAKVVNDIFNLVLGRNPGPSDFNYQPYLAGNGNRELVMAQLFAGTEFFNTRAPAVAGGAPGNDTFLKAMYQILLPGVDITTGSGLTEFTAFLNALNAGTMSRFTAAYTLLTNPNLQHSYLFDPQVGFVTSTFQKLTGVPATASDLATWKTNYGLGFTDLNLVIILTLSSNYMLRTP
jgi:subtilisin-like proprotein convertase family protein